MNLQIITNLYPLPWEPGRASFNRQQFEHLSSRCKVSILVLVPWLEAIRHSGNKLHNTPTNPAIDYCKYYYLPKVARFSYAASLFFSLWGKRNEIIHNSPDCILASWAYPDGVAATLLSAKLKLPLVLKVHGSDINVHMQYRLRSRQIRWAMRRAKAVIAVSKALAIELINAGVDSEKVFVIYNGIDHHTFFPESREQAVNALGITGAQTRKKILFVGNLKFSKGCNDLLEAFIQLTQRNTNVELIFIGSGVEAKNLESRAQQNGLLDRVKLLGAKPHSEINHWMNLCDLVALPSHNEGVPNVLLEAMACGKPVVATRVGGIPEVVSEEAGILVEPQDSVSLAQALFDALALEWDEDQIAKSASQYCWESNVDQVLNILANAIDK